MKVLLLIIILNSIVFSDVYYYSFDKKIKLTPMKKSRNVTTNINYYLNEAGQKIGVKNEILVKCKYTDSCDKIFVKYNFKQTEKITPKLILIILDNNQDVFAISQELYEEEDIDFAHPNFIKKRYRR